MKKIDLAIGYKGEISRLKLRDYSNINHPHLWNGELFDYAFLMANHCTRSSIVRSKNGDEGQMYAFGRKTLNSNYVSMRHMNLIGESFYNFHKYFIEVIKDDFEEEIASIQHSLKRQNIIPDENFRGVNGLCASMVITKNYRNASHIDLDDSKTILLYLEKILVNQKMGILYYKIRYHVTIIKKGKIKQ